MHIAGIPGIIFSALLMSAPAADEANRTSAAVAAATQVEIEVVEVGASAAPPVALTVPAEGKVEARVDGAPDGRQCKVEVHGAREGHHFELRCSGGQGQELRVEATRAFAIGSRVKVAEVRRSRGPTSQVFVTLR